MYYHVLLDVHSGIGDLHETKFHSQAISIVLTGEGLFSATSPSYTLTLYPSQEFNDFFRTKNPIIATIGSIVAILITSVCFFSYDCMVNRDLRMKKQMFVAGWNHRKRFEAEKRKEEDAETAAVDTATTLRLVPMSAPLPITRTDGNKCTNDDVDQGSGSDVVSMPDESLS